MVSYRLLDINTQKNEFQSNSFSLTELCGAKKKYILMCVIYRMGSKFRVPVMSSVVVWAYASCPGLLRCTCPELSNARV